MYGIKVYRAGVGRFVQEHGKLFHAMEIVEFLLPNCKDKMSILEYMNIGIRILCEGICILFEKNKRGLSICTQTFSLK